MAMTTSTFFKSNVNVIKRIYEKTNKAQKPLYAEAFNIVTPDMKRSFWTYQPITEMGTFALKTEGQSPSYDDAFEGLPTSFNFLTYALAYRFTEEANLEDAMGILPRLPRMLSQSELVSKELLFWQVFNLAFDSATIGTDGLSLCNTAHTLQQSISSTTTLSNSGGTTALSVEALNTALVNFETLLSDRGMPTSKTPRILWVHPNLRKTAEEILGSSHQPYTANNTINYMEGKLQLRVSRFLTTNTNWFVTAGKGDIDGDSHSLLVAFKWQNKNHSWIDDATGNLNHKASFRTSFGWNDWRGFYGSQGS